MSRHQAANPNNRPYQVYEHTGFIVGYKIEKGKAVLILNDSTSERNRTPRIIDSKNGIGTTQYTLSRIKRRNAFDIYDINY